MQEHTHTYTSENSHPEISSRSMKLRGDGKSGEINLKATGTQTIFRVSTHSSVLAWKIPGTGEPGGLPAMGPQSQTRLK